VLHSNVSPGLSVQPQMLFGSEQGSQDPLLLSPLPFCAVEMRLKQGLSKLAKHSRNVGITTGSSHRSFRRA